MAFTNAYDAQEACDQSADPRERATLRLVCVAVDGHASGPAGPGSKWRCETMDQSGALGRRTHHEAHKYSARQHGTRAFFEWGEVIGIAKESLQNTVTVEV